MSSPDEPEGYRPTAYLITAELSMPCHGSCTQNFVTRSTPLEWLRDRRAWCRDHDSLDGWTLLSAVKVPYDDYAKFCIEENGGKVSPRVDLTPKGDR